MSICLVPRTLVSRALRYISQARCVFSLYFLLLDVQGLKRQSSCSQGKVIERLLNWKDSLQHVLKSTACHMELFISKENRQQCITFKELTLSVNLLTPQSRLTHTFHAICYPYIYYTYSSLNLCVLAIVLHFCATLSLTGLACATHE